MENFIETFSLQKQQGQASNDVGMTTPPPEGLSRSEDPSQQYQKQSKQPVHPSENACFKPQSSRLSNIPPSNYNHISMLIVNDQHHQKILSIIRQKYDTEASIVVPFKQEKLKGAQHTAFLYHNIPFSQLHKILIFDPSFQTDRYKLLLIEMEEWLKILPKYSMNVQDMTCLEKMVKERYPNEKVELWRLTEDDGNIVEYIRTQSAESTLYVYIVLNRPKRICSLSCIKNKNWTTEEKKRFIKVYPKA